MTELHVELLHPRKGVHKGGLLFHWDDQEASITLHDGTWVVHGSREMSTESTKLLLSLWLDGFVYDNKAAVASQAHTAFNCNPCGTLRCRLGTKL